jgi:ATP-dependent RNA helicase HelY
MAQENLSAAERFSRAKTKQKAPSYNSFLELLEFQLDPFQEQACHALADGKGVLVAAPTGAGKTIVGEFAIHLAIEKNLKVFYTTPIKALSNQKYAELVNRYGNDRVGLLTGDSNTNSEAQIVVMTTEVLRNMIYANSTSLIELGYVVMDEVHYLADRFRGAVWEEVILHLPKDVILVSLSATVSNAEEFGAWLDEVRGDTEIVVSEHRPVPLDQHVLFGDELLELFAPGSKNQRVNSELVQKHSAKLRIPLGKFTKGKKPQGQFDRRLSRIPKVTKPEVVEILEDNDLLPAIFFIFSRVGCDSAVRSCLSFGVRLTNKEQQLEIRAIVEEKTSSIAGEDLATLGYFEWLSGLERGVAAHHAGMLPAFKEVVEELFLRKLVKVVFATETLALGINMPARTVVLERLDKFNGESRVQITPGEYTQLTGRAGRRGIDTLGHSIIQWSGNLDPASVAGLASKRSYPLVSPFRPTANMAVNLIEAFGRSRAREVLETSFAQFQADRSVVGLAKGIREKQISLDGFEKSMQCHLGDFFHYSSIRRELTDIEKVLSAGNIRSERGKDLRQTKGRSDMERKVAELKVRMKTHACHACKDREAHSRWAERWWQLHRETQAIIDQIDGRTNLVASTFDKICDLLIELNYLDDSEDDLLVTESGKMLARIYGERDLMVAEAIRLGIWNQLDAAGLAAMAAALVYEPRRDDEAFEPRAVRGAFEESFRNTQLLWEELESLTKKHKLPRSSRIEMDLSYPIFRWATGAKLDVVLDSADLLPGDFIRWCKQIIDLLEQLARASEGPLSNKARDAVDKVKRGIVAYSYYA